MRGFLKKIKAVPWWGWVFGIVLFILNFVFYRFGAYLSRVLGTVSYAFECKIPAIDDLTPLIPIFVLPYVYSYIFWICGPVAVSLTKKRNFINYLCGFMLAYIVGFIIFVFCPTYMDRVKEGLMAVAERPGIFNQLLAGVYAADGGEMAFNLFPSYHCLISVYCYLGVRKQPEISRGFKLYSLIMAILICASTQFTKQHYILDVVGGVGIAVVCYILMNKLDPGKKLAI